MAMPLMGVSHKESLKTVGVAIQAFAYDLNFKHWQDCVLKLLVSSPSLNCVKLYHWSTWSKCFKAVDKSGTTSHLRDTHTHTPCCYLHYQRWQAWEAWREQPQGRAEWIHICIYGPPMRCMGPVEGKYGGTWFIQPHACLVHGSTHSWFIYMLYVLLIFIDHNMIVTVCIYIHIENKRCFSMAI